MKNKIIEQIRSSIYEEIKLFNQNFYKIIQSKVDLMNNITHYIMKLKGKQIRPILIFLIAKMLGKITDKTYNTAYLIELIHIATLIHDDVVDNSHLRRGNLSINALWKNKIAVLVGDYIFSKSMILTINKNHIDLLKIVLKTIEQMSEGELLEIEQSKNFNILNITEKSYEEIILYKTASLISASCEVGAYSIGANKHICAIFRKFGELVGLAFQMKDDLFDYENYNIGKPVGIDFINKKITLPLIYTLQKCNYKTQNWIIDSINKVDKNRIQEIIKIVRKHGGIDYTINKMKILRKKSLKLLNNFPENSSKKSLKLMVDYIIYRKI